MTTQKTCSKCRDKGWYRNPRTRKLNTCHCNEVLYRAEFLMDLTGATKDQAVEAAAWGISEAIGSLNDRYRKYK